MGSSTPNSVKKAEDQSGQGNAEKYTQVEALFELRMNRFHSRTIGEGLPWGQL